MSKVGNSERSKAIRLLATGLSQSEASRKLGISRQKLSLWCKKEAFQQELLDAKKKFLQTQVDTKLDEPVINQPQTKPLVQKVDSKEQLREKEMSLLGKIEAAMMPQLEAGSVRAAIVLLKLSESRCKLLGLNQKKKKKIIRFWKPLSFYLLKMLFLRKESKNCELDYKTLNRI